MGTYSDVYICAVASPPEDFKKVYLELMLIHPDLIKQLQEYAAVASFQEFQLDKMGICLKWDNIKWYEDDDVEQSYNKLWEYLEDKYNYPFTKREEDEPDVVVNACWVRLTEDDYEEERFINDGHEIAHISRYIDIN